MIDTLDTLFFLLPKAAWHIENSYIVFLPILGLLHALVLWLIRRQFLYAFFAFLFILIYHFLLLPILKVLPYLGVDSFLEVNKFDLKEAFFWIGTLLSSPAYSSKVYFLWTIVFALYAVVIFCTLSLLFQFSNQDSKISIRSYQNLLIVFIIILPISIELIRLPNLLLTVAKIKADTYENFSSDGKWVYPTKKENGLSVLLYIGESTSKMHMQAYGYPRKTNENINKFAEENESFLIVDNVFSTHTHSVPSLLDALSLKQSNDKTPILFRDKKLVSVVDVLVDVGIPTGVISNSSGVGSNDRLFSTIFQNVEHVFTSDLSDTRYDAEFFDVQYKELSELYPEQPSLQIFHSYAGHGPYLDHIPNEFRDPVDSLFLNVDPRAVLGSFGSKYVLTNYVEAYDSAISYVDYSVVNALSEVKKSDYPTAMVYFSDHGESPFTSRGHDSSRFIAEMLSVPMFIYFNEAAIEQNATLFQDIKDRVNRKNVATLSELSYLILELLGVEIEYQSSEKINKMQCKMFDSRCTQNYVLIRDLGDKIGAIGIAPNIQSSSQSFVDLTDDSLKHKIIRNKLKHDYPDLGICYHRSNSMAKVIRGKLVSNCIEIDVVVHDNEINIFHPPAPNVGFSFDIFLRLISGWNGTVWIDAKNIDNPTACEKLVDVISNWRNPQINFMLEFPSNTITTYPELENCLSEVKSNNISASYYMPSNIGPNCLAERPQTQMADDKFSCIYLENLLTDLLEKQVFSEISFDINSFEWIKDSDISKSFFWNSWNVEEKHLDIIPKHLFNNIILTNKDPNNI